MTSYAFHPEARSDLDEIWEHIPSTVSKPQNRVGAGLMRALSLPCIIVYFLCEEGSYVPLTMKNTQDTKHVVLDQVVDAHIFKIFYWPGAQACEKRVSQRPRYSDLRHSAEIGYGAVYGVEEASGHIQRVLKQVVAVLRENIVFRGRPDEMLHGLFFRS